MKRALDYKPLGVFSPLPGAGFIAASLAAGRYRISLAGLERRCPRCREYWPADTEFFSPTPSARSGLSSWCKACHNEARAARKAGAA